MESAYHGMDFFITCDFPGIFNGVDHTGMTATGGIRE